MSIDFDFVCVSPPIHNCFSQSNNTDTRQTGCSVASYVYGMFISVICNSESWAYLMGNDVKLKKTLSGLRFGSHRCVTVISYCKFELPYLLPCAIYLHICIYAALRNRLARAVSGHENPCAIGGFLRYGYSFTYHAFCGVWLVIFEPGSCILHMIHRFNVR